MSYLDFYRILQCDPAAEPEVIAAAYRSLARRYHPDLNPSTEASARMAEINAAYAVLSNPERRAEYDARRGADSRQAASQDEDDEDIEEMPTDPTNENYGEGPVPKPPRRFWASPIGAAMRWIGVVPGGLLMAVLVMFPIHWMLLLAFAFGGGENGDSSSGILGLIGIERVERLAQGFSTPFSFIYFGYRIAPSRKLEAAFVLLLLMTISLTALHVWLHTGGRAYYQGWDWLEYGVLIFLNLGGTVSSFLVVRQGQADNIRSQRAWR